MSYTETFSLNSTVSKHDNPISKLTGDVVQQFSPINIRNYELYYRKIKSNLNLCKHTKSFYKIDLEIDSQNVIK